MLKYSYNTLTSIKDNISYVNSDTCKKLQKTNNKNISTSSAMTIKLNNILSTILIILVFLIYFIF